ncbi:hypothetical protein D9M68_700330 [compost metagenome]
MAAWSFTPSCSTYSGRNGSSSVIATMVVKEPNMQTARLRCQCAWVAWRVWVMGFVMGRIHCVARGAKPALPIRGGAHRGARRIATH